MTSQKEQEDLAEKQEQIGKGESNDSPEIPDRGKTSDIHGLPCGCRPADVTLKGTLIALQYRLADVTIKGTLTALQY